MVIYQNAYPLVVESRIVREPPPAPVIPEYRKDIEEILWLLALKEGTILAATDYWLEDNALHYVRRDGTPSAVSLSEIDLPFTKQLNGERGLAFRLPTPGL